MTLLERDRIDLFDDSPFDEEIGYGFVPDEMYLEALIQERRHFREPLAGGAIINPAVTIKREGRKVIGYDFSTNGYDLHVYVTRLGRIIDPD